MDANISEYELSLNRTTHNQSCTARKSNIFCPRNTHSPRCSSVVCGILSVTFPFSAKLNTGYACTSSGVMGKHVCSNTVALEGTSHSPTKCVRSHLASSIDLKVLYLEIRQRYRVYTCVCVCVRACVCARVCVCVCQRYQQ